MNYFKGITGPEKQLLLVAGVIVSCIAMMVVLSNGMRFARLLIPVFPTRTPVYTPRTMPATWTPTPTRTRPPSTGPAQPTFTPQPPNPDETVALLDQPGVGAIRWSDRPEEPVAVLGPMHASPPASGDELQAWVKAGEACLAAPGTLAVEESRTDASVEVTVLQGDCSTFRGWVPLEAWNAGGE